MALPTRVRIVEVGPRDGLQNEPLHVPTALKINFINQLSQTGLRSIEAASFVSPKWVPQMSDSDIVMSSIDRVIGVNYPVLVPNIQGLEASLKSPIDEICVFGSASESFSHQNIHCSIEESYQRFAPVIKAALNEGLRVRGYISCTLGCPYEGEVSTDAVIAASTRLFDMGCYEIALADTIGVGTPGKARNMVEAVSKYIPMNCLAVHFHDTYGQALANIFAVLELGISVIDSSVAGLGGCPYAPAASGNVASEDVIYMLNGLGIETGVDLDALVDVGWFISTALGRSPASPVSLATKTSRLRESTKHEVIRR